MLGMPWRGFFCVGFVATFFESVEKIKVLFTHDETGRFFE